MSDRLENICKDFLNINESIPVIDIVNFLEKNKIYYLDSLFLINFEGKQPISLNSRKVHEDKIHKILGFKKMEGRYGSYYHIYCEIYCNGKTEYEIFISNKKITSKIDERFHEKLNLGISSFVKKHVGYRKVETFNFYKKEKLKKMNDSFWVKTFSRSNIYFLPRELKNYKGITYREIDFTN